MTDGNGARMTPRIAGWATRRVHHRGLHGHQHISRQRRTALSLTIFAACRVVVWTLAMLAMGLHFVLPHNSFLTGYYHLCQAVAFVTFISLYCNWSTDLANFGAGVSSLFAADSHHDAEAARTAIGIDFAQVEQDIARLAQLQPGPEATRLASEITARLG